jgi:hypothetical protein
VSEKILWDLDHPPPQGRWEEHLSLYALGHCHQDMQSMHENTRHSWPPITHYSDTRGTVVGGIPPLFSTCPIISHCNLPCFVLSEGPNLQHLAPTQLSKKIIGALRRILGRNYQKKQQNKHFQKMASSKRITTRTQMSLATQTSQTFL